jgi:phosphoribosylamine-glycine ligase
MPPWLTAATLEEASKINRLALHALQQEVGQPYCGILYGNYLVGPQGLRLIEFNCRFGDPEVMNLLPMLETNFAEIAKAIATGTLTPELIRFRPGFTVVKYLVPEGHPSNPVEGVRLNLSHVTPDENLRIYHGGLNHDRTTGSRAVAMVGIGDTLEEAEQIAERAASEVPGPLFHRRDIGTAGFLQARLERFQQLW